MSVRRILMKIQSFSAVVTLTKEAGNEEGRGLWKESVSQHPYTPPLKHPLIRGRRGRKTGNISLQSYEQLQLSQLLKKKKNPTDYSRVLNEISIGNEEFAFWVVCLQLCSQGTIANYGCCQLKVEINHRHGCFPPSLSSPLSLEALWIKDHVLGGWGWAEVSGICSHLVFNRLLLLCLLRPV